MVSLRDLLALIRPSVYLIQPTASSAWREWNEAVEIYISMERHSSDSLTVLFHVLSYSIYSLMAYLMTQSAAETIQDRTVGRP
jgi:hypothetical protein